MLAARVHHEERTYKRQDRLIFVHFQLIDAKHRKSREAGVLEWSNFAEHSQRQTTGKFRNTLLNLRPVSVVVLLTPNSEN